MSHETLLGNLDHLKLDSEALLKACQASLPSWVEVSQSNISTAQLTGGFCSVIYLVSNDKPGVIPNKIVVKIEELSEKEPFVELYKMCATETGSYQELIARQVGEAGLGPKLFPSPRSGIIVMEAVLGGRFEEDFGPNGLSETDAKTVGELLRYLHKLDTSSVELAAQKTKELVKANMEKCSVTEEDLECIWKTRGGYGMLLLWWWGVAFPNWLKKHHPDHFPLRKEYSSRVMALIRSALHLNPKTRSMASMCFSHGDLWSGNLLRKGRSVLAIDFEIATTAPAFVDLGGLFFNWEFHFLRKPNFPDRGPWEALAVGYLGESGELEEVLFDLEIGFIHRYIFVLLCKHLDVKGDSLEELELVEKGEKMVRDMERGGNVL